MRLALTNYCEEGVSEGVGMGLYLCFGSGPISITLESRIVPFDFCFYGVSTGKRKECVAGYRLALKVVHERVSSDEPPLLP